MLLSLIGEKYRLIGDARIVNTVYLAVARDVEILISLQFICFLSVSRIFLRVCRTHGKFDTFPTCSHKKIH